MTAPLFYVEDITGETLTLAGAEGRHAVDVRRLRPGERIDIGDGRGTVAECTVAAVARGSLTAHVAGRRNEVTPEPRLVVVQALATGGRDEDAIAAMTECGVDEVVPWQAERAVARWKGERSAQRWASTVREAAKQSRRAWIPVVAELATTADVAARLAGAATALVLHESATDPMSRTALAGSGDIIVVVGPEGGISTDEIAQLGAPYYRLGDSVLRSGTAGVAALAALSVRLGRW